MGRTKGKAVTGPVNGVTLNGATVALPGTELTTGRARVVPYVPSDAPEGAKPPKAGEKVTVIPREAHVRSTPRRLDDLSNVVGAVRRGDALDVLERLDGWVRVGEGRYVFAECVR
ncbi:MAG: hypothetical protein LBL86_12265 [Coriobacteriales bacterium]|jgi:hypothetical protein|nr:hypothetical protein [Coriobacteriales bacterium]